MIIYLFLLLSVIYIFNLYLLKYIHNKKCSTNNKPVPDLFHNILPQKDLTMITNIIVILHPITLAILSYKNRRRLNIKYIFIAFFIQYYLLILLRTISLLLTSLPPSKKECCNNKNSCGIFSANMIIILLSTLYVIHFNLQKVVPNIILILSTIVISAIILISRNHYSIDILYSYIITFGIFYLTINKLYIK